MRWQSWILAALVLGVPALPADAQSWLMRPIRLVVPHAPGGAADALGRVIEKWGKLIREAGIPQQ